MKKVYCLNPKIILQSFRRLPSGHLAPRKIKGAKGICPYCGSTNARLIGQYFDGIDPNDKDGKRRLITRDAQHEYVFEETAKR